MPVYTSREIKILAVVLGIPFLLVVGCHRLLGPFTYYSDPIRMRLIDEHTHQPVENAVVVAVWVEEGWGPARYVHKVESASDRLGNVVIPGLPRTLRWPMGRMEWRDPVMLVYKPGYGAQSLHNYDAYIRASDVAGARPRTETIADGRIVTTGGYSNAAKRFCYWNGKTIPLAPLHGVEAELQTWEAVDGEVGLYDLLPTRFPRIWQALVEGYDRLPPSQKPRNNPDPREIIKYWSRSR